MKGFTLIELLVVVATIVVVLSIVGFSLSGTRSNALDDRRRADLATIVSGLVKYRSDCGVYPTLNQYNTAVTAGRLVGGGTTASCASTNVYIDPMPTDPESPSKAYSYNINGTSFALCTALGQGGGTVTGCTNSCGSGFTCNYKVAP